MKFSEEHKKNISLNHADVSGDKNPMFGKNHSLETKNKIRNSKLNCKLSKETIEKFKSKRKGEDNNNSKLTKDNVIKIRNFYNSNTYSQKELASIFNVKPAAIYKIVHKITWKHVD